MVELLEAIRVFRETLRGGNRKSIRVAAAALICAIGDAWMSLEQQIPFSDSSESESDAIIELSETIADLGVEVPKEGSVGLGLLFSILLRLLIDEMKSGEER